MPQTWAAPVVISRRVILQDRHPLFGIRLASRFGGRDFGLLARACACQCDRHDCQELKTETQTCTSDQRILPGATKWISCRNDSVENGGCGLSLTRRNLAAQGKNRADFQRVTGGASDSKNGEVTGTALNMHRGSIERLRSWLIGSVGLANAATRRFPDRFETSLALCSKTVH